MYPSYLEYFRERNSISLVDFDYDRNLFEFEQNSALPVLKGRLLFSYSDASNVACGLSLWALTRCPIICGLLAKQLRALPGENLRLYNLP